MVIEARTGVLDLCRRAIQLAEADGATQAEALVQRSDQQLTRFANSEVHQNVAEVDTTVSLRFVDGKRIGVWGASFKPDSDDVRDSPALDVASALQSRGANVGVYDPKAMDNAAKKYPQLDYCHSAVDAARDADLILHLTEWAEFRMLDPATLAGITRAKRILDGRGALNPAFWRSAGWTYRALGRP